MNHHSRGSNIKNEKESKENEKSESHMERHYPAYHAQLPVREPAPPDCAGAEEVYQQKEEDRGRLGQDL